MAKKELNPIIKKYGHVTIDILETVYAFTAGFIGAFDRHSFYKSLNNQNYSDEQIFNNMRALLDRGYIEKVVEDNRYSVVITNKGKLKLLENSKNTDIDGKWRFISFDIPEELSRKRNLFRRTIKRIGYRQVQRSLWASPFVKTDQVAFAISEYELEKYVAYFIIEKTDIEGHLKKLFRDIL